MSHRSLRMTAWMLLFLTVLVFAGPLFAAPAEPTADTNLRDLRPNHVRTWAIFNDLNTNGILDPGDQRVAELDNWWTPVSSHTQHNYSAGPYGPDGFTYDPSVDDMSSGPMSFAHKTDPAAEPYWLERKKNAIEFYMTYSQRDNHNWEADDLGLTGDLRNVAVNRHKERNGWALGWLTHDIGQNPDGTHPNDQSPGGTAEMDIFVHRGAGTFDIDGWGVSKSDPQVSMSNDISHLALDDTDGDGAATQLHPPQFDGSTQTYSTAENQTWLDANGLTTADLAAIIESMETREHAPYSAEVLAEAIHSGRTPQAILDAGLTDHTGVDPYLYEDAFFDRSTYAADSNDGGVIAGLSGYDEFDSNLNNWGDQQVIRIDVSAATLAAGDPLTAGNISEVIFYDFGRTPGSSQVSPAQIVLNLSDTTLFPENRFYIAMVSDEPIPEPGALAILAGGAAVLLKRRRRRDATAV